MSKFRNIVCTVLALLLLHIEISSADTIVGGTDHSCAIQDGQIFCWGRNDYGQLGDGTLITRMKPQAVINIDDAIAVTAGRKTTCAVENLGSVKCWGRNWQGSLGVEDKELRSVTTPQTVNLPGLAEDISMASRDACALLQSGQISCWGSSYDGNEPVLISGIESANRVSVATSHACAVMADGGIMCWGFNGNGELGDGTRSTRRYSAEPVLNLYEPAVDVATNGSISCAVLSSGQVMCWGSNAYGYEMYGLGGGTYVTATPLWGIRNVKAISSGGSGICVVYKEGSDVPAGCWGSNEWGELGDGWTTVLPYWHLYGLNEVTEIGDGQLFHRCAKADDGIFCWGANWSFQLGNSNQRFVSSIDDYSHALFFDRNSGNTRNVEEGEPISVTAPKPVLMVNVGPVDLFSTGDKHTCAESEISGTVKCVGSNLYGQLKRFNFTDEESEADHLKNVKPVEAADVFQPIKISSRGIYTCALQQSGKVLCWGWWVRGGGYGPLQRHFAENVRDISVGYSYVGTGTGTRARRGDFNMCAVLDSGRVECQGFIAFSSLRSATGEDLPTYPSVPGINNAIQVSSGQGHACAVRNTGVVSCWGTNDFGKRGIPLGLRFPEISNLFGETETAVAVSANTTFNCAVLDSGSVKCWGQNLFGQLGNGTLVDSHIPVTVSGIDNAIAVTTGKHHACALLETGAIKCWGQNHLGQLGNGRISSSLDPAEASLPVEVVDTNGLASAIDSDANHTCALIAGSRLKCWGEGTNGQLGNMRHVTPERVQF